MVLAELSAMYDIIRIETFHGVSDNLSFSFAYNVTAVYTRYKAVLGMLLSLC